VQRSLLLEASKTVALIIKRIILALSGALPPNGVQ
jgi:hypothetical protein